MKRQASWYKNRQKSPKLGFISDPDAWLAMRLLRNRLVHEYVEDLVELAAALQKARSLKNQLTETYGAIRRYAAEHLQHTP